MARTLPLFTRLQVAEAFACDPMTVTKWESETPPLPIAQPGGPGKASLYAMPAVFAWRLAREKASKGHQNGHVGTKDEAFALQATANTERIRLDIARRRGEVFDAKLAIDAWSNMTQAFRAQALALPRSLAERLTQEATKGSREVEAMLMEAMRDLLTTIADWKAPE